MNVESLIAAIFLVVFMSVTCWGIAPMFPLGHALAAQVGLVGTLCTSSYFFSKLPE